MSEIIGYKSPFNQKRTLSKFLCQEIMYDYVTNKLDKARVLAVEECLSKDPELKQAELALREAINYCDQLSKTEITQPFMDQISADPPWYQAIKRGTSWRTWPEPLKWAFEAGAVSLCVAVFVYLTPWHKIGFFNKNFSGITLVDDRRVPILKDLSEVDASASNIEEGPVKIVIALPPPVPHEESSQKKATAPSPKETSAYIEAEAKKLKTKTITKAVKGNAFVYRAFMSSGRIDELTPEIVATLSTLGGKKAGQVELGWKKPNGSYFHFSISEEQYLKALVYLNKISPVTVEKSAHRRVMPEGFVRVILWVEKKN